MSDLIKTSKILVTGGIGFLGAHVVTNLRAREYTEICAPRSCEYDLTHESEVIRLYRDTQPDVVIHLAAIVGGSAPTNKTPAGSFTKTC